MLNFDAIYFFCGGIVLLAMVLFSVAIYHWVLVARTLRYLPAPMRVDGIEMAPNYLYGEYGGANENGCFVRVRYFYVVDSKDYCSKSVFPLEVEWIRPRKKPLDIYFDIKNGNIVECFYDPKNPRRAVLYRGWTTYLMWHCAGVFSGALIVLGATVFLCWLIKV